MAAVKEPIHDDHRDSQFHQEMMLLGRQQIESLGRVEAKFDALLKVLEESQVQLSQIVNNTSGIYNNDEEKHKAVPNLSSSSTNPLHQP
ncbi:hypothetical protein MKW92_022537, partial [Papaver armeniacum]